MTSVFKTLVFIGTFLIATNSFSYNSNPEIFISELVDDAIRTLANKNISIEEKEKKIEIITLENVDINGIGMYTLGEARKSLDANASAKYKILFEKYFLKSLTSRLKDYSEQKFEVISSDRKSDIYTIVQSRVLKNATQPELKINWRVYTKNMDKPLIRDLVVEGLSLARTQKEEFASILNSNNNDINVLFSKLEDFIKD